jgi:hypothetical protein
MENFEERDGNKEENLYNKEAIETAISDDEISPEEEAFMHGYNRALDED